MANTETKVDLVINRMSQSKYEQLKSAGQLNPNQIYMTTDGTDPVPETRKVNGKTLEADVTLTGADIAVSTTDSTKINTALAGKADTNHTHSNYVPTSRTIAGQDLTANITAATLATAIGLDNCVKNNSSNSIEANESSLGFGIYNNSATSGADAWLYLSSGTGEFGISTSSTDTYMLVDQYQYRFPSGGGTLLTSIPTSYKTYADTLTQLGTDGFKTYADTKTALDSVYKPLQTAKTDPTASGTTTDFIDTISQNANGVITATKKTIQAATTQAAGIVQLNDTLSSTSTTQAATANAVKTAYDGCLKNNVDDQIMDGVKALNFKSNLAFPDDSYTEDALINYFNFYDSTGYNLADLNTRQTTAGDALLTLSMTAPFGDNESDITSYLRLYVNKAGKYAYASVPTPPNDSNANVAATTKWVRDNCIVTSGVETQAIKGTKILRMWSPLDWEAAVTGETLYNMIEFRDNAFDYIGAIKIVKYSSGNTKLAFECKNPTSTKVSYMQLVTLPDGTDHVTLPTPPYNSNSNIAATTEWVRNALNTRIPRSQVSATTLQLKNQTCNTISISTAGTYVFIPPEKISSVSRHYYLYVMNNTTSDITVKFSRTNPGEATASVAYYTNATFTPTTTLAGKSGYVYEFLEFSPDAMKVTQEQMYRRTALEN